MNATAALASTKLSDVLRSKSTGEPVNVHVVELTKEPQPDFEAMQRLISGSQETEAEVGTENGTEKKREVSPVG